ncbi:MAG: hypothetical protein R2825_03705 [Saprospiraceae bacterium]
MEKQKKLHIRLELIWWMITLVIIIGLFIPIYTTQKDYPFWMSNTIFVLVFITFSRYIFLLKHTFIAHRQTLKAAIAILCIPLFIFLLDEFSAFRAIAEEIGIEEMFDHLSLNGQTNMTNYVKSEMLFFGAASIISCILMPFRMLVSFWRTYNNKGIV